VVEILSPRTARLDLENKRVQYARHGVVELWIIDPNAKTVAIHRFSEKTDGPVSIVSEGGSITTRHFPGLEVDTRKVFAE
jgi:Uma2 family endonuclease